MRSDVKNPSELDERSHHASITELLKDKYRAVKTSVASRHADMIQIKQQLQDQARDLNHADKANLRQAANMASRVGEFSVEQQKRLQRLIESPYFGRIDCRMSGRSDTTAIYIGVHAFSESDEVRQLEQELQDAKAEIERLTAI